MTMRNIMGEKINKLREKRLLTQRGLAAELGVSLSTVFKWEKGTATPSSDLLPAMARLFGVTIDELFQITNKEALLKWMTRHSFNLEPDKYYDILYQAENFLESNGPDAEIEYRIWMMKNLQLIHTAKQLALEAEAFAEKYAASHPHLNQPLSIASMQGMSFALGIGKVIEICLSDLEKDPSLLHHHRIINIYLYANRPEDALQWCRKTKSAFPREFVDHYIMESYFSMGRLVDAEKLGFDLLHKYKKLRNQTNPQAIIRIYNNLFQVLEKQKKYEQMLKLLDDGLEFLPEVYKEDGRDGNQIPFMQEKRKERILGLIQKESDHRSAT